MNNTVSATQEPSAWLKRFFHLLPDGESLDVACGSGRNALFLHSKGKSVTALDKNIAAFEYLQREGIMTLSHDLEAQCVDWPFGEMSFSSIVVCNYLHRPLFPYLLKTLKLNGVLIYETFAVGNEAFGKPSSPRFLLRSGELLSQMRSVEFPMQVIAYEEGYVSEPKPAIVQRICARRSNVLLSMDIL